MTTANNEYPTFGNHIQEIIREVIYIAPTVKKEHESQG
jgi:hypothetical protein